MSILQSEQISLSYALKKTVNASWNSYSVTTLTKATWQNFLQI